MFIVVLLLSIFVLWNNLKYYQKLFVPDKYLAQEMNDSLKKVQEENAQGLAIFMAILIFILPFSFYCIAANVFIENKLLMGFAIFELIMTLFKLKNAIRFISGKKFASRNMITRILFPIHTVFIGYFIYYYIINLT